MISKARASANHLMIALRRVESCKTSVDFHALALDSERLSDIVDVFVAENYEEILERYRALLVKEFEEVTDAVVSEVEEELRQLKARAGK